MGLSPHSSGVAVAETRPLVRLGGIPRVRSRGPFGALGELARDHFGALRRWQKDYGGVFELRIGPASFIIAADANAANEVLVAGGQTFVRGGTMYKPLHPLFGTDSMLMAEGPVWRQRRRSAQPSFRQRAISVMTERVDQTISTLLDELSEGPNEIHRFSGRITMSVALAVVFADALDRAATDELGEAIDHAVARVAFGWLVQRLPPFVPIPGRRRYKRCLTHIDEVVYGLINKRRAASDYGDDLLAMLLHMTNGDGEDGATTGGLSDRSLRNEAVTLLSAGYETTASGVAWALHELAGAPEVLARVQAEADAALADGAPHDLRELSYTRQVFMEALRMYPSGIWLPRNTCEDTTLAGYPIAKGASVLCSTYLVHHDPHAWTDPERFDPERFAEGGPPAASRQAYMPFGLGQHMCVGQHLAMLEGTLALARIAQRFNLRRIPGRLAEPRVSTTMTAKDGIWLDLQRR